MAKAGAKQYRFSFGPWNIDEGADPFGPTVRKPEALAKKIRAAKDAKPADASPAPSKAI